MGDLGGTVLSTRDTKRVQEQLTSHVENLDGAHNSSYRVNTTVAVIESGKFKNGDLLVVEDRANCKFNVVPLGAYSINGYDVLDAGDGNVAVLVINGPVPAGGFGVSDGAIRAAISKANALFIPVDLMDLTYTITSQLTLPTFGLVGSGKITGSDCLWQYTKTVTIGGGFIEFDELTFDSVWFSALSGKIRSLGNITYKSSNSDWGTYWNHFGDVETLGTIIIDTDGQSINQNMWGVCYAAGGLHIKGVLSPSGAWQREAHNNYFASIDTTGANLSSVDGSSGWHVLNDSVRNQRNTIGVLYGEASGNRGVKGEWSIVIGSNIDSNNLPYYIGRGCSALNAGGTSRNGSFLAASVNRARGGDWSELNTLGIPYSMSGSALVQVSALNAPDGNPLAVKQDANDTFRAIDIIYPLSSDGVVSMTMYVYQEGNNLVDYTELLTDAGVLVLSGAHSYTKLGNGWLLLRVSGVGAVRDDAGGHTTGRIRIYQTLGTAFGTSEFRYFGSYFLTVEETCLLPCYKDGIKTAYGTSAPTGGKWNTADRWVNTSPAIGSPVGGTCTTGGTSGTWASEGNLS